MKMTSVQILKNYNKSEYDLISKYYTVYLFETLLLEHYKFNLYTVYSIY